MSAWMHLRLIDAVDWICVKANRPIIWFQRLRYKHDLRMCSFDLRNATYQQQELLEIYNIISFITISYGIVSYHQRPVMAKAICIILHRINLLSLAVGDRDPHLIQCFLGPSEYSPQTVPCSVVFLQDAGAWQTDRQTNRHTTLWEYRSQ